MNPEAQGHEKLMGTVHYSSQGGFVWRDYYYIINEYKEACGWELPGQGSVKCLINYDQQGGGERATLLNTPPYPVLKTTVLGTGRAIYGCDHIE